MWAGVEGWGVKMPGHQGWALRRAGEPTRRAVTATAARGEVRAALSARPFSSRRRLEGFIGVESSEGKVITAERREVKGCWSAPDLKGKACPP